MFAVSNGTIFERPEIIAQAAKKAGMTAQLGMRTPMAMEQYREYIRLGIAESSSIIGDLNAILKDTRLSANGNLGTDSILAPLVKSLGKQGI